MPEGLSVAVGGNGEGKTNLLEGLYYLMALSSPRTSSDLPLVRRGATEAYLRGEVEGPEGRALVEIQVRAAGANRIHVNRSPVRRRSEVRRLIRAVLFSPGDLALVQGDPNERRSFMDEAVGALWPPREGLARAYDKALRQRNRLLKDWEGSGAPPGLAAWDVELIRTGVALTVNRAEGVGRLGPHAAREFQALTGYGLQVAYQPSVGPAESPSLAQGALLEDGGAGLEEAFRRRLAERREDELVRRVTLVGPHRDELVLSVRDLTARAFASHGEAWAAALSLRLGLAGATAEEAGEPPVLLLDDPFPGLDPVRQGRLTGRLLGRGQTVLTVADETHVPDGAEFVWAIRGGSVSAVTEGAK